MLVATK